MEKKRSDFIDIIRFIALFLMLWGHCRTVSWNNNSVEYYMWWPTRLNLTFNMALFMVVSGYLFYFSAQKRNLKELLVARSKPLLCTIVVCGVLYWLFVPVLRAVLSGNWSVLFSAGWMAHFNDYWFLWSVLACSVSLAICCKITKNVWIQLLLLLPSFALLFFFPNAKNNVWMYPFFVGGYYYAQYKDTKFVKILTKFRYVALFVYPLFFIYWRMQHCVYFQPLYISELSLLENVGLWLFRWGAGFTGSICVLTITKILYDFVSKFKKEKYFKLLAPVGKNSLEIYVLSCIFLTEYLSWVIQYITNTSLNGALVWIQSNLLFFNFVFTFVITIAFVVALQVLVFLLGKWKIDKYLFGRSSKDTKKIIEEKEDSALLQNEKPQ